MDKLRTYRAMIKDVEREIARAERAGLEVEEMKVKLKLAKERLEKLLAEYGKG